MATRYRDSARELMRDAVLDAAAGEVVAHGWDGLQVRAVASRAGVSRQTLYNAFGDKHGLARTLVMRLLDRFLDGIDDAIAAAATLDERWRAAVRRALEIAADDVLLRSVLTGSSTQEFLPLLTSDASPVITRARDRLVAALGVHHPDIDPRDLAMTAETVTRLTISHIVLPLHPPETVAAHVAACASRLCTDPPRARRSPRS